MASMIAALLLVALSLPQEDLPSTLRELAAKLSKDGISGRLADAAASDAGVQAVEEKIEALLYSRIARLERDPSGCFEDYLFSTDANGDLVLRPERRTEFETLRQRLPGALKAMAAFNLRANAIVQRLGDADPMDRLAKKAWADSGFRAAFFHRHPAELRERDDAELLDLQGFRGLERQADGKLRLAGPYARELRDRVEEIAARLEEIKAYEKAYLRQVAAVADPDARAALARPHAAVFLLGRVLREIAEGATAPIGALKEGDPAVAFALDLAEYAALVKDGERTAAALGPLLEPAIRDLDGDARVVEVLKDESARVLIAERMLAARDDQRAKADEIMNSTLTEDFTAEGERLTVKKGRHVDENGQESPEALTAALNTVTEEFAGTIRQDFDRIAERCVDADVISVLENKAGTYLLMEYRDRVLDRMVHAVRQGGLDAFVRAYLVRQGDGYAVRPDRTTRVEALLRRIEQIRKEQE